MCPPILGAIHQTINYLECNVTLNPYNCTNSFQSLVFSQESSHVVIGLSMRIQRVFSVDNFHTRFTEAIV